MVNFFPSIWIGQFRSAAEFDENLRALSTAFSVYDWIDDRLLHSRHPFTNTAYCSMCERVTDIRIDWQYAGAGSVSTSINPAWSETAVCAGCGLNSRMRALIDFLKSQHDLSSVQHAYITERLTPLYQKLKQVVPNLVGSEYMGAKFKSGAMVLDWPHRRRVRHEDLTELSFADNKFDLAITLDVFEHIPNYRQSFVELRRVISTGGHLVFTIPFFPDQQSTRIRAEVQSDGKIVHHLPPEIHGNPVSDEGSLCFQNFGWDILDDLRGAGFSDAYASLYWGPWQGHLG